MKYVFSFVLLFVFCSVKGQNISRSASLYIDSTYGFAFHPPNLGADTESSVARVAVFTGPAKDDFSSNVNIMVQNAKMTREAYRKISLEQFKAGGIKVTVDSLVTVNSVEGIYWEYQGLMNGRDLCFISLALIKKGTVYLITGTCTPESFKSDAPKFRRSVMSMRFF
jgi:hypothetical protein